MSNLREVFENLSSAEKKQVQRELCKRALSEWDIYCAKGKGLQYRDSVVGMKHKIDIALPKRAYEAACNGTECAEVTESYQEPIVAMQDMDWEPPEKIEYAYYAIYNFYRKHAKNSDIDDWLIVNQALSSQPDDSMVREILGSALPNKI